MGEFIQSNGIWLTPIISVLLTIVIKIASKPEFLTLNYLDYLDFGFDLCISSVICLVASIKSDTGSWILLLSFLLIFVTSTIVNRIGWNKETNQRKLIGVLIPDFVGLFLLVIVSLYIGGVIK